MWQFERKLTEVENDNEINQPNYAVNQKNLI